MSHCVRKLKVQLSIPPLKQLAVSFIILKSRQQSAQDQKLSLVDYLVELQTCARAFILNPWRFCLLIAEPGRPIMLDTASPFVLKGTSVVTGGRRTFPFPKVYNSHMAIASSVLPFPVLFPDENNITSSLMGIWMSEKLRQAEKSLLQDVGMHTKWTLCHLFLLGWFSSPKFSQKDAASLNCYS